MGVVPRRFKPIPSFSPPTFSFNSFPKLHSHILINYILLLVNLHAHSNLDVGLGLNLTRVTNRRIRIGKKKKWIIGLTYD